MVRLLAVTVVELIANAVGLLVAKWLLPGFVISVSGFVTVVAIFTVVRFILAPLIFKLSFKYFRAITGGIALVTTFVGLLVTTWLTSGLVITGVLDLGDRHADRLAVRGDRGAGAAAGHLQEGAGAAGGSGAVDPADAVFSGGRESLH